MDTTATLIDLILVVGIGLLTAAGRAFIKTRLTPSRMGNVLSLVQTIVSGVQAFGKDHDLSGEEKLAQATVAVQAGARRLGVRLSDEEVTAFIHAALEQVRQYEQLYGDIEDTSVPQEDPEVEAIVRQLTLMDSSEES